MHFGEFVRHGVRFASARPADGRWDAAVHAGCSGRFERRYADFGGGLRSAGEREGRYCSVAGGQLLLARVQNLDMTGAGGTPLFAPSGGVGAMEFAQWVEVPLVSGAGLAVFAAMDRAANLRESAQVPTFLMLEQRPEAGTVRAGVSLNLGPLSKAAAPSRIAPVPRFQEVAPPGDCSALGDCDANLFPRLAVEALELT